MEEKATPLSAEEIEKRIDTLLQAMRSADPEELERIKGIIRKKVKFFDRMTLAAYLMLSQKGTERPERRPRPERSERKPQQSAEIKEKREVAERTLPEDARTLYINIGKMKHLYAKDLSKLLQTELGITRDDIYQIRVHDKYSFVTMSQENCEKAIEKLNSQTINGRTAKVTFSEK